MTYKLVYLARRAATVSREDWPRTWKSHAVFASQFPVLEAKIAWMRYCNRIDTDLGGFSSTHDGVAVAASDSLDGLTGAGFSDSDRALIDQDELRVFDMLTTNFTFYCEEMPVLNGPLSEVAVYSFLARKPGITHAEFDWRWSGGHAAVARATLKTMTRYVHNRPVHDPLPLFPFDGIAEAWFASAAEAKAAHSSGEFDRLHRDLAEFCDLSQSVVMLTETCHRWPRQ